MSETGKRWREGEEPQAPSLPMQRCQGACAILMYRPASCGCSCDADVEDEHWTSPLKQPKPFEMSTPTSTDNSWSGQGFVPASLKRAVLTASMWNIVLHYSIADGTPAGMLTVQVES